MVLECHFLRSSILMETSRRFARAKVDEPKVLHEGIKYASRNPDEPRLLVRTACKIDRRWLLYASQYIREDKTKSRRFDTLVA